MKNKPWPHTWLSGWSRVLAAFEWTGAGRKRKSSGDRLNVLLLRVGIRLHRPMGGGGSVLGRTVEWEFLWFQLATAQHFPCFLCLFYLKDIKPKAGIVCGWHQNVRFLWSFGWMNLRRNETSVIGSVYMYSEHGSFAIHYGIHALQPLMPV